MVQKKKKFINELFERKQYDELWNMTQYDKPFLSRTISFLVMVQKKKSSSMNYSKESSTMNYVT